MSDIKAKITQSGLLKGSTSSQGNVIASKVEVNTAGINLGDLIDVTITSPVDGSYVVYDSNTNTFLDDQTITKTDDGITLSSDMSFPDDVKAKFGNSGDLRIYHDTTSATAGDGKSIIEDAGTQGLELVTNGNAIVLRTDTGKIMLQANKDAGVLIGYDNTISLQTQEDGVKIIRNLIIKDDKKILLGTDDDLQIWHESSTGNSYVAGNNLRLTNNNSTESYLQADVNGAVSLYYNGSPKIATTNSGVDITGKLEVDGGANNGIVFDAKVGFVDSSFDVDSNDFSYVTNDIGLDLNGWNIKNASQISGANLYVKSISNSHANPNLGQSNKSSIQLPGYDSLSQFIITSPYGHTPIVDIALDGISTTLDITTSQDITAANITATTINGEFEGTILESPHILVGAGGTESSVNIGSPVYISGHDSNGPIFGAADASDPSKMPAVGIVKELFGNFNYGVKAVTFGNLYNTNSSGNPFNNIPTVGLNSGADLYVSATTPGTFTETVPAGEGNLIQKIGVVLDGGKVSGKIQVLGTASENVAPNLNSGNILIGNASNISTTASFNTTFDNSLALKSTDNITEGDSNLYFTNSRADARVTEQTGANLDLSLKTTDELPEGSTNVYHTPLRAVSAVTASNLDMGGNKVLFANVYSTEGDLPNAGTYHGMFAHVHETGKGYFAHAGAWHKLLDESSSTTDNLSEGSTNLYYTDARVDSKLAAGVSNIVTTGYLRGPAEFTIDPAAHGNNTGKVIIAGDLQVDGTTTTINSTTLDVDDINITLASGSADKATASGAGITVDIGTNDPVLANPKIEYVGAGANDYWLFNKNILTTGSLSVTGAIHDSSASTGTSGQALLSTGTGTGWGTIASALAVQADSGDSRSIDLLTETLDIAGGTGISTNTTTDNTVTIDLAALAVDPSGTYGNTNIIPQITVDNKGRVTGVTDITIPRGAHSATTFDYKFGYNTGQTVTTKYIQLSSYDYTADDLKIRINYTNNNNNDIRNILQHLTLSDSNPRGYITLINNDDAEKFVTLKITDLHRDISLGSSSYESLELSVERIAGVSGASTGTTNERIVAGLAIGDGTDLPDPTFITAAFSRGADEGVHGGNTYEYNLGYDTSAVVNSGEISINSYSYDNANRIRIPYTDSNGNNNNDLIKHLTLSDSNPRGHIIITNKKDPSRFVAFSVTDISRTESVGTGATEALEVSIDRVAGLTGLSLGSTGANLAAGLAGGDGSVTYPPKPELTITFTRAGNRGTTGATGPGGTTAFEYIFDNSTATSGYPQSGKVRFNNANVNAASQIDVHNNAKEFGQNSNISIKTFLDTVAVVADGASDSTIKGYIRVSKQTDINDFAMYKITGGNNFSYHTKLQVTPVASTISNFTTGERLIVSFARTGDAGNGAAGINESDVDNHLNNAVGSRASNNYVLSWSGTDYAWVGQGSNISLLNLSDVGNDGSNGQVLTTDGNGAFSFTTVSASNRTIKVDTDGDGTADNTLGGGEDLVLKAGTNVTLAEAFGVVTINSSGGGGSGTAGLVQDADADTKIQVEESADEDIIRFDIAGTELMTLDADELELKSTDLKITGSGTGSDLSTTLKPDNLSSTGSWRRDTEIENKRGPLILKGDGTKLFVLYRQSDTAVRARVFTLSTAYDISSITTNNSTPFTGATNAGSMRQAAGNPDLTKIYLLSSGDIQYYTSSDGWSSTFGTGSISTYTFHSSFTPKGIAFKSDGSVVYFSGVSSGGDPVLASYSLTTNYDLSSAVDSNDVLLSPSAGSILNFETLRTNAGKSSGNFIKSESRYMTIDFAADGKTLYMVDSTTNIRSFKLTTAWDISTVTLDEYSVLITPGRNNYFLTVDTSNNIAIASSQDVTQVNGTDTRIQQFSLDYAGLHLNADNLQVKGKLLAGDNVTVDGDLLLSGAFSTAVVDARAIKLKSANIGESLVLGDETNSSELLIATISASDINTTTDTITAVGSILENLMEKINVGDGVYYDSNGNTAIGGLLDSEPADHDSFPTRYYAIKPTANTLKLATSYENAINGIAIDLTGTPSGSHKFTYMKHEISIGGKGTAQDIRIGNSHANEQKIFIGNHPSAVGGKQYINIGTEGRSQGRYDINIGGNPDLTTISTTYGNSAIEQGNINIGSTINSYIQNINLYGSTTIDPGINTDRNIIIGGTAQAGTITLGRSTVSNTINIGNAATASGQTQTINIGASGASGSTTTINIGKFTLPTSDGNANQVLKTDGNGNLAFVDQSSGNAIAVKDEGNSLTTAASTIDFAGAGVTATESAGTVTVTIPGGGGSSGDIDIITASLSDTQFKAKDGKRLLKVSSGGSYEYNLFQPVAADIGKSWTVINADSSGSSSYSGILIDSNSQRIRFMDGSSSYAISNTVDATVHRGGIAEIVCVAANANGGTSQAPNFIIYGSGILIG